MFERKLLTDIKKHLERELITVIVGARQTGKSTILEQVSSFLKAKGETCSMLTLEDPTILSSLNEHPENIFKFIKDSYRKQFVLIDEIQYLDNPSNFLKLIYDKYKTSIKLVVTGSSAFYIDSKFKDSLAGRKRIFELYPLDFEEFITFRGAGELIEELKEIRNRPDYISPSEKRIRALFDEHLTYGGYPAVVLEENYEDKKLILKELITSYLKRDVMESGIQYHDKFFSLITLLAHQSGSLLNINELSNTLKLSVTAVDNYITILRRCFHINLVPPYYSNVRKELTKMPKAYFNDTGFRNIIINLFTQLAQRIDKGALIENYTYTRLRQLNGTDSIKYWRTADGNEVDFIVRSGSEVINAFEVKYDYSEYRPTKYKKFKALYPNIEIECRAYIAENNKRSIMGL